MKLGFSSGILTLDFNTAGDLVITAQEKKRNYASASTVIYGWKRMNENPPFCKRFFEIFTPLVNVPSLPDIREPFIWPTGKTLEINTPPPGNKILLLSPEQKHLTLGIMGQDRGQTSFCELKIWPYNLSRSGPHGDSVRTNYLKNALADFLASQP